jgi:hypothetical protein
MTRVGSQRHRKKKCIKRRLVALFVEALRYKPEGGGFDS